MKLGKSVLLEIVAIVQDSLIAQEDASERLREIDVKVVDDTLPSTVELSDDYLQARGRV